MKKIVSILLIVLTGGFFCITRPDHFTPEILLETRTPAESDSFDLANLSELIEKPLHYIGNGLEAVAFVTHDDKYVFKFFLKRQILDKLLFKPKKRWKQLFSNWGKIDTGHETLKKYEWAHEFLQDETGVLAVHAATSSLQLPFCTLIDYRGKKQKVDLNKVAFVVQKKAKIITNCMDREEFAIVNSQLRELFSDIARKGFVSKSHTFNPMNFAILEGRALMIDVGKLDFAKATDSYEIEESKLNARYMSWMKRKLELY